MKHFLTQWKPQKFKRYLNIKKSSIWWITWILKLSQSFWNLSFKSTNLYVKSYSIERSISLKGSKNLLLQSLWMNKNLLKFTGIWENHPKTLFLQIMSKKIFNFLPNLYLHFQAQYSRNLKTQSSNLVMEKIKIRKNKRFPIWRKCLWTQLIKINISQSRKKSHKMKDNIWYGS